MGDGLVDTVCPFCGVGCGMRLRVEDGRIAQVLPRRDHPVSQGQLCIKGWNAEKSLCSPERLTQPLMRRHGRFEPVSFEAALTAAAAALRQAQADGGADAVGIISSARATNEDNFAAMKFARAVLRTNNIDHCARICHAPSVAGLSLTLGSGAMTNAIGDLALADCLLVVGSDTTENHPIIGARLLEAHRRGARLIVIDPRRTRLADFADLFLQLRLGTDIPLINGMIHAILAHGWEDRPFIDARCDGFEALAASVADFTPERVAAITAVPASVIVEAARQYATTPAASLIYCLGITQHVCGTDNVIALSNLALVTGHIGTAGGGINPLRGQNNVQGACDMGALPDVYCGYQRADDAAVRAKFGRAWSVDVPARTGLTSLAMEHAAHDGALRAMMIIGEDPVVTDPAQTSVCRALDALDCLIVVDLFLTDTARHADIVFPAAAFAEKDGTFTSTERRVQRVRRAIAPPGEARADWELLAALAAQLGQPLGFASAGDVFREITGLTPIYAGMSYERLEAHDGLQWPCPDPSHPGTPILHAGSCTRGKGRLIPTVDTPPAEVPDAEYPLAFTTFRVHAQYGGGSMTRRAPLCERENPRCELWIHPHDARQWQVLDGAAVVVRSRRGRVLAHARITDRVPVGTVAMPYHFREAPSNLVTNNALDPISKMPELKVCAVAVERA